VGNIPWGIPRDRIPPTLPSSLGIPREFSGEFPENSLGNISHLMGFFVGNAGNRELEGMQGIPWECRESSQGMAGNSLGNVENFQGIFPENSQGIFPINSPEFPREPGNIYQEIFPSIPREFPGNSPVS